jgi:phenylpyruvate tautomerase PptA (4-oxalocrotonate tautomerase family)
MPLVRIDIVKGVRTPEQVKRLADVIQQVLLDHFNAPPRDRYQVC